MALIKCPECGKEISDNAVSCPNCGYPFAKETSKNLKSFDNKRTRMCIVIFSCVIVPIIGIIFILGNSKEKINVTGNNGFEYLEIIERYGRDINFDGITIGANCYTGKQTKTVQSKKYGKVTVEFSYCNPTNSYYIHVYN